ncbi:MAG: LamG domain-containing protein [Candidatus Marinimicrobia bacterium]|nr:LamG domain-containing protein [Candidatus Neomarinimicrobiota bacterium]
MDNNTLKAQLLGNSNDITLSASTLSTNTWYHVAFTFNGVNSKLYLNGIEENSSSTDPGDITNVQHAVIGARQDGTDGTSGMEHYFKGIIDEVRI